MIRPFTLITMLLAALSGAYLFAVKHRAQVLDDQIAAFNQSSREDAMRIRVLQGQWSLETDPTRLQQLAAQFTSMQPMQPAQLMTMAALRDDLPAPGSPAPASNPALPMTVPAAVPAVAQQDLGRPFVQTASSPRGAAPVALASLAPERANRPTVHRVSHSALHLADTELAEALPPPRPYQAPMPAQMMPVKAISAPEYVPVMASQDGGSMLGMASNLAPPQPMPENGNDN